MITRSVERWVIHMTMDNVHMEGEEDQWGWHQCSHLSEEVGLHHLPFFAGTLEPSVLANWPRSYRGGPSFPWSHNQLCTPKLDYRDVIIADAMSRQDYAVVGRRMSSPDYFTNPDRTWLLLPCAEPWYRMWVAAQTESVPVTITRHVPPTEYPFHGPPGELWRCSCQDVDEGDSPPTFHERFTPGSGFMVDLHTNNIV